MKTRSRCDLTASEYAQPTLWGWLESRERKDWPTFIRGDIAHGNQNVMPGADAALRMMVPGGWQPSKYHDKWYFSVIVS